MCQMTSRNALWLTSLARCYVALHQNQNLVSWDVLYFCQTNKCHIYSTPLWSSYLCDCIIKYYNVWFAKANIHKKLFYKQTQKLVCVFIYHVSFNSWFVCSRVCRGSCQPSRIPLQDWETRETARQTRRFWRTGIDLHNYFKMWSSSYPTRIISDLHQALQDTVVLSFVIASF